MKISTFLGFCLLAFVNLQSTHGYVTSPQQYGRTFDLFNLFPFVDNSYATLSSRISTLESSIASTNTQVASLLNLVQSMSFGIQSLQTQVIAANAPKCPATVAATGKVIGNFCYTLGTMAKSFTAAQTDCAINGGTLAEPTTATTVAASKTFYDSIKSNFDPTFTTAVGANNLWIGLKRVAVIPFTFQSGAAFTAVPADIFDATIGTGAQLVTAAAAAGEPEGATLEPSGKYRNEKQSENRNFICQYPAF